MFFHHKNGVYLSDGNEYFGELMEKCIEEIEESPDSINSQISIDLIRVIAGQSEQLEEKVIEKVLFQQILPSVVEILLRDPTNKHAGLIPYSLTIAYLEVINIVLLQINNS
eukprot:CAMPEP_0202980262 /NCGR_PEP_ID=MMETSP1396-20130829/86214_1 /ASSEMBLY_ACC=CAM_ASM_000872 /TAXON_ID= /ORGANISM="Pseudokeronopsis sp., Strain Brazil" /LENGTH=110 /DNA_ID=CAMNT_0049720119 /DNA_START=826 /DNA_END=1158 /DNA_ORIENTATION=-